MESKNIFNPFEHLKDRNKKLEYVFDRLDNMGGNEPGRAELCLNRLGLVEKINA